MNPQRTPLAVRQAEMRVRWREKARKKRLKAMQRWAQEQRREGVGHKHKVRFRCLRRFQDIQRHQGNCCVNAAVEKQQSFWDSGVFCLFFQIFQLFKCSSWGLFMQYGSSQALYTQTCLHIVIATSLSMSAFITGIISFVGLGPLNIQHPHKSAHHPRHHHLILLAFCNTGIHVALTH